MEMLKATHLLLEQPKAPLVVFLAVDPQLIISAIAESLEGVPNTVSLMQLLFRIRANLLAVIIPFEPLVLTCAPYWHCSRRSLCYVYRTGESDAVP